MIAGIHQPHYLPWLRYIDKIARSDVFVLLDSVQYTKNGWQNRNKIKSTQGWMYLTVPVLDAFGRPITEVRINNQTRWRDKHWAALVTNYSRAPFFGRYRELLEPTYREQWDLLHDLSVHTLELLLSALGIRTPLVRSSTLGVSGSGTELLANICAKLGATTYLSGDYAAGTTWTFEYSKNAASASKSRGGSVKSIVSSTYRPVSFPIFPSSICSSTKVRGV